MTGLFSECRRRRELRLAGEQGELARHLGRHAPPRRFARVFLQLLDREPGACKGGDDLSEAPEPLDLFLPRRRPLELEVGPTAVDLQLLVEVVLAPAQA